MTMASTLRAQDYLKRFASLGKKTLESLNGLVQWLVGNYYKDSDGNPVDGSIYDKAASQGANLVPVSGWSLELDGINDSINFGNVTQMNVGTGAFSYVFRGTPPQTVNRHWMMKDINGAVGSDGLYTYRGASGIVFWNGSSEVVFTGADGSIESVWVITRDGSGNVKLYWNGTEVNNTTDNRSYNNTTNFILGVAQGGANFGDFKAIDMAFYTRELTPDEISKITLKDAIEPSDYAFNPRMIESIGGTVQDYSGNRNHGNINGATWALSPNGIQVVETSHSITQNICDKTEDLTDSVWSKISSNITSGETDPNGGTGAFNLYPTSSGVNRGIDNNNITTSSSKKWSSIYMKANGKQWVALYEPRGFDRVWFDLINGVVGTQENNSVGTIEDVGNGWYRCTVRNSTASATSSYIAVRLTDSDGSVNVTTNGTDGILLWRPQISTLDKQIYYANDGNLHNINEFVNLMGEEIDSSTDLYGVTITDFVYDKNKFVLPKISTQIFDGADDYVSLANIANIATTDRFKFKFKIYPAYNGGANQVLFVQGTVFSNRFMVQLADVSSTEFDLKVIFGQTNGAVEYIRRLPYGYVYEGLIENLGGDDVVVTINGVTEYKADIVFLAYDGTGLAAIGTYGYALGVETFKGIIYEVEFMDIAKWTLSGGWQDEVGSNDGTLVGSPESVIPSNEYANHPTAETGQALSFDGINDEVTIPHSADFQFGTGDFTFFSRVRITNSGYGTIIDKYSNVGFVWYAGTSVLRQRLFIEGVNVNSDTFLTQNVWHSIAVVRSGGVVTFYLDGVADGGGALAGDIDDTGQMKIGNSTANEYLTGQIESSKIWNVALNTDQILKLHKNPNLDTLDGVALSAYKLDLKFVEGALTTVYDYSSGDNDGTIDGATWVDSEPYPVRQLVLDSYNFGASNVVLLEDPNNLGFDILGNPLEQKQNGTLNFPLGRHEGITKPHQDVMNPTDGFTMAFWADVAFLNSGDLSNAVIFKGDSGGSGYGIKTLDSTNFQLTLDGTNSVLSALVGVQHYVIVVALNGDYEWYRNGVLISSGNNAGGLNANTENLYTGIDANVDRPYSKPISEAMYFNRVITASEVETIYNIQKSKYE